MSEPNEAAIAAAAEVLRTHVPLDKTVPLAMGTIRAYEAKMSEQGYVSVKPIQYGPKEMAEFSDVERELILDLVASGLPIEVVSD